MNADEILDFPIGAHLRYLWMSWLFLSVFDPCFIRGSILFVSQQVRETIVSKSILRT
jgi:hypothetical protein